MSYESSPKSKMCGGTFCRPEKRGAGPAQRTSSKYCPECKLRVRGKNHEGGTHHKSQRS